MASGSLICLEVESIHTWQYGGYKTVSLVFTAGTKDYYAFKEGSGFVTVEEANAIILECSRKDYINLDDYGWVFFGYEFLSESLSE